MNLFFQQRSELSRLGLVLAVALFSGCGSKKPKNLAGDCKITFEKVHDKFERKKYAAAKEGFDEFVLSCTGTEFAEQAYFELSESHFALKEWMEAEHEYQSFLKEYPGSKRYGETARYRLAICMGKQTQIPARDQSKTVEAIKEFETFLAEFPESSHLDSAKIELDRLHELLAERDMRVARLYSRMDEPLAAALYYKHILKEYGDRIPRREITLKLTESYIMLRQFVEAQNQLAQFDGIAKDDPFREKIKATQIKLEKAQSLYARQKSNEKKEEEKKQVLEKSQSL